MMNTKQTEALRNILFGLINDISNANVSIQNRKMWISWIMGDVKIPLSEFKQNLVQAFKILYTKRIQEQKIDVIPQAIKDILLAKDWLDIPKNNISNQVNDIKGISEATKAELILGFENDQNLIQQFLELRELYIGGTQVQERLGATTDSPLTAEGIQATVRAYLDPKVQYNRGVMYETGRGVTKDERTAFVWYKMAAAQGYLLAQSSLGSLYATGRGVTRDDRAAVRCFEEAAEAGDARAQFNLGIMYTTGRGIESRDALYYESRGRYWYEKAAEQKYAKAERNMGLMCETGRGGCIKSDEEAFWWYKKAAQNGDAIAQCALASMYAAGRGCNKDEQEALKWYVKAAHQGDARAQSQLKTIKEMAEGGNIRLQYQLGVMYLELEDVRDYAEAFRWFMKAAEQGNIEAQRRLGDIYNNGLGVTRDYSEAIKWYRMAKDKGDATAGSNLGAMYLHGTGVRPDPVVAFYLYKQAADKGNFEAKRQLADMYQGGIGVEKNVEMALTLRTELAQITRNSIQRFDSNYPPGI